jgi:hypothetical protein
MSGTIYRLFSGGKVRDFSLSLEMTGNNVSSIFAHQQSRYFASGSIFQLFSFQPPPRTLYRLTWLTIWASLVAT